MKEQYRNTERNKSNQLGLGLIVGGLLVLELILAHLITQNQEAIRNQCLLQGGTMRWQNTESFITSPLNGILLGIPSVEQYCDTPKK